MNYIVLFLTIVKVHVARSGLRIIGGTDVSEDEFPYVVRLEVMAANPSARRQRGGKSFCTASVLAATWTLTAAHCIQFLEKYEKNHPDQLYKNIIRIGNHADLPSNSSDPQGQFEILSHHKHPAYKGVIIADIIIIENDIGLLHTESVALKEYAKVSAVDFSTVVGQEALAVGYGISVVIKKGTKHAAPLTRPLKVLDLIVVKCPKLWHMYPAMCVSQRCGRSPTMCAGDSGGPLLHPSGIIALTSVNEARDCTVEDKERSHTVGVLTAVSPYITWITSHVLNGK